MPLEAGALGALGADKSHCVVFSLKYSGMRVGEGGERERGGQ